MLPASRLIVIAAFIGSEPDVRMEANSIGAVLSVIRSTTLATLLPAAIAGQFDDVVAIELRPALLQRTACLLQRQGAWQSAAAREFITLAREKRDND
ncbi:cyn operon transcriptional activator [Klebsiella aerogenes]|nr:cyn operon transcriptional activator [Klebsiella aerogenes]